MLEKMIMTSFEIGKEIAFTYLKGADKKMLKSGVTATDYSKLAGNYSGTVVDVRNIEKSPLANQTVRYGKIKGERSEQLVTVELPNGEAKAFYDGRMVNPTQAIS
jgi:hypothetical protein